MNLDCHLFTVHKWDKLRSSSARLDFGLRKKREPLSPTKRKSKPRGYERMQCPEPGGMREVLRIHNHLHQTHKITDSVRIKELTKKAKHITLADSEREGIFV